MRKFIALFALTFVFSSVAWAEEAPEAPPQDLVLLSENLNGGAFAFEYGVPATPALTIIGATGDAIPTHTSLQRFSLSLLRAAETAGGGSAAGLDISPYWGFDRTMALANYRNDSIFRRWLYRSRVSAAYTEGNADDDAPSRAAIGFATSLLDSSDAAMISVEREQLRRPDLAHSNTQRADVGYFSACVANARDDNPTLNAAFETWEDAADEFRNLEALEQNGQHVAPNVLQESQRRRDTAAQAFLPAYAEVTQQCREHSRDLARRGRALDVGAAFEWLGEPGELDGMRSGGSSVWTTFTTGRTGFLVNMDDAGAAEGPSFRGVAHLRLDFDRTERSGGADVEYDRQTFALGVERLGPDSSITLQASYRNTEASTGSELDGESYQYLLRGEFRADRLLPSAFSENAWLSVSLGAIDGEATEEDTYMSVAIRFKAPEIDPVVGAPWGTRS